MITIYALLQPETKEIRYIGKTNSPLHKRLSGHLKDKCNCYRTHWLRSLRIRPEIVVIEKCADDIWEERERFWIAHYRSLGCNLVNQTIGGDGPGKFTPEVLKKMSLAQKGRKVAITQARRDAISRAKKGKTNGLLGKKFSAERCRKMSITFTGRISPFRGIKQSADLVQKRIESRRNGAGFAHSEASRKRMSETSTSKKRVICMDTGEVFESIALASLTFSKNPCHVGATIKRGGRANGKRWAFL